MLTNKMENKPASALGKLLNVLKLLYFLKETMFLGKENTTHYNQCRSLLASQRRMWLHFKYQPTIYQRALNRIEVTRVCTLHTALQEPYTKRFVIEPIPTTLTLAVNEDSAKNVLLAI